MKKFVCYGSWEMSYDDTVDLVIDKFFNWYGVKPPKNSVIVSFIQTYPVYTIKDKSDYKYTIEFAICPKNTGRSHSYILKYDGFTEIEHCMEH